MHAPFEYTIATIYSMCLFSQESPKCEVIDVKVADKKIVFDIENGDWNTVAAKSFGETILSSNVQKIRKQNELLQEENNLLKLKVEILLSRLAESIAEKSSTQH
ncbi:unnamed protein product [Rotaria sordida]|uniref:Uncharacterized protein n=1 Tax=Rotaria sordida TaxID=392033 RepID=A0A813NTF8_9BILA|nr:unnamed protein product [Rotaria sordida]CAF0745725.1 unnamed protein product [Rotaria sordida]